MRPAPFVGGGRREARHINQSSAGSFPKRTFLASSGMEVAIPQR